MMHSSFATNNHKQKSLCVPLQALASTCPPYYSVDAAVHLLETRRVEVPIWDEFCKVHQMLALKLYITCMPHGSHVIMQVLACDGQTMSHPRRTHFLAVDILTIHVCLV